jgi:hypothetical protein
MRLPTLSCLLLIDKYRNLSGMDSGGQTTTGANPRLSDIFLTQSAEMLIQVKQTA